MIERRGLFNFGMIVVLVVAGIAHFVTPEEFIKAVPPVFLAPKFIVYLTGVLEFFFAIALMRGSSRSAAAGLLALYFVLLIPAHVYVAFYGIEMFGVSSKIVLWIRTFLQSIFIAWALYLRKAYGQGEKSLQ